MNHHIEYSFVGYQADQLKSWSFNKFGYRPHITLVPPFSIRISDEILKKRIFEAASRQAPIPFLLEGRGSFGTIQFIPVVSEELGYFADTLESSLSSDVSFVKKLGDQRILHVTLGRGKPKDQFPQTQFLADAITGRRNGEKWFVYDLHTHSERSISNLW